MRVLVSVTAAALMLAILRLHATPPAAAPPKRPDAGEIEPQPRVLVFSKTAAFRHDSIPAGVDALKRLGTQHAFMIDATEDSATFTHEGLAPYRAVVFLNTTGDVLDDQQQIAFEKYIRAGGGFVGIHSATDTEYDWPWYGRLVGAYFCGHPKIQQATVQVTDRGHPSTQHLPENWQRIDEWYNFRDSPQQVRVLAMLDESTYEGGTMKGRHPIAWCHEYEGGRAWYTAGGHTIESYSEGAFLQHLLGGIQWAIGPAHAPQTAPAEAK
jgi:type 1 glutamine amidotransferase